MILYLKKVTGRTDFLGGSDIDMEKSIKYIYDNFDMETYIFPGHGDICKLKERR